MPQLLGRREQPRVLVIGISATSEFGEQISGLVPTVRFLDNTSQLGAVRQADWDVAVLIDTDANPLEKHLFVFQVGGVYCQSFSFPGCKGYLHRGVDTVATEFVMPDDLPRDVARLIRTELAPRAIKSASSTGLGFQIQTWLHSAKAVPAVTSFVSPFLLDPDDVIVAGRFRRDDNVDFWTLPSETEHLDRWFAAALAYWREVRPEVFPAEADWSSRAEWRTVDELEVETEIAQESENWARLEVEHQAVLAGLEVRRQEAVQAADEGDRRLLTAQGDDLVDAVKVALSSMDFAVTDVDEEIATAGDKREDLRVSDLDLPEWRCLVEVRGYGRGAQLNDLLRLGRFVTRYVKDEKREPDAVWYIVNHHRETDPSTRPLPLESNSNEVDTFAQDGGVVIDTRDLFRLVTALSGRAVSKQEARGLLRDATARLLYTHTDQASNA